MPNVGGKKFPYTKEGMKDAKNAAKKNAVKMMVDKKKKSSY